MKKFKPIHAYYIYSTIPQKSKRQIPGKGFALFENDITGFFGP